MFNGDGPVNGSTGQLEWDPDNNQCNYPRPVFATCKNNCPGGELCYQLSVLSYFLIIKFKKSADELNVSLHLRK